MFLLLYQAHWGLTVMQWGARPKAFTMKCFLPNQLYVSLCKIIFLPQPETMVGSSLTTDLPRILILLTRASRSPDPFLQCLSREQVNSFLHRGFDLRAGLQAWELQPILFMTEGGSGTLFGCCCGNWTLGSQVLFMISVLFCPLTTSF